MMKMLVHFKRLLRDLGSSAQNRPKQRSKKPRIRRKAAPPNAFVDIRETPMPSGAMPKGERKRIEKKKKAILKVEGRAAQKASKLRAMKNALKMKVRKAKILRRYIAKHERT